MSESSKSASAGQPHGSGKSDKLKRGKADKTQTKQIDDLQKVISSVNERLVEWVDSSGLPDVEALTDLFLQVGIFLGATMSDERTSDKHSTLDKALSIYLEKHGKQISIPSPSQSDLSTPIGIGEAAPDRNQTSSFTTSSPEKTCQEHSSSQSTQLPKEPLTTAQTPESSFDFALALSELKQVRQKIAESEKKTTREFEVLQKATVNNGEILGQIRSTLNRLPTIDTLDSKVSSALEAVQRLSLNLQAIQTQVDGIQTEVLQNNQVLHTIKSSVNNISTRIDGKIDITDAHKVLDYREMMENHIQASVIDHLSKQILLPLEALKHAVSGQTGDIADTVAVLEDRCKKAGLSID